MTDRGRPNTVLRFAIAALLLHGGVAGAEPYGFDLRLEVRTRGRSGGRPPGLDLKPRIDSALYFVGNINLAENSADEIDTAGIEAAPGIYATYKSNRANGTLDYTFIGRAFEAEDYDSVSHLLNAHGSYMLARDLFFIDAQAGYSDSIIDAAQGANYGGTGLFSRGNMEETGRASVTPRLTKTARRLSFRCPVHLRPCLVLRIRRRRQSRHDLRWLQRGLRGPRRLRQPGAPARSGQDPARPRSRPTTHGQESQYELSRPYRYEKAGADTSLRLTRTLRLVADGGVETDLLQSTSEGGLDADFWHAGFRWPQPDSRTSVDARYGHRFFGDSYSFEARRETRLLTLRASYTEDPEVETRRVGVEFDPDDFPLPPSPDSAFLPARGTCARTRM